MIYTRAWLVYPITWCMLKGFQFGYWLKGVSLLLFYPYAFLFILLDALYNVVIGTFIFWELPRNVLFTGRLEDHKAGTAPNSTPESKELAEYYCKRLNEYDPGHC